MKINNITNNANYTNYKNRSFKGLPGRAVDGMVKATDSIERAGFIAAFICQDVLGSILPRILTGLTRNSDKTGELNYKFAALEACREILTGPPVMLLPIATFALARKKIGEAITSPVNIIESFSKNLSSMFKENKVSANDLNSARKTFYQSSWENALKDTCGKGYTPDKLILEKLTGYMGELEAAKGRKEAKGVVGKITELVQEEIRRNGDVTQSFARVTYKDGLGKSAQSPVGAFADHISRFAKDAFGKLSDAKVTTSDKAVEVIEKVKNNRAGARVVMNFATLGAILLYSTVVPKLYKKINKTNPGLIGLTDDDTAKNQKSQQPAVPVDYEAFVKLKKSEQKPAFKGFGLGKLSKAVQKDGGIRKFANSFEFDGINMSYATLMSFMGFGVLVPRVVNAYDKHDLREILTRDLLTIASLVYGSKALLKNIANHYEKKSGIVLSEKPADYFQKTPGKRFMDTLKPFSGIQVFSNNDIALKYTNVENFKGGLSGFCEFVSKTGGNLAKFFANDKTTKSNMEQLIGKTLDKATEAEIIDAVRRQKDSPLVQNIINVFKDSNNTFVKKAKSITGVFGFISTFLVIPGFMIFLQKFNEKMTKTLVAKEQAEKKAVSQKFNAIKLTAELKQPEASKLFMK